MPEIIYSLRKAGYNINDEIKIAEDLVQDLNKVEPCKRHIGKLDDRYFESLLKSDEPLSFKSVYEKLLPKPSGTKFWGEKSLNNSFFLKELSQLYPDSLFINIIRDPRSSILSQYKKGRLGHKPDDQPCSKSQSQYRIDDVMFFAKHAAFWSAWYQVTERLITKHINPQNIINLKYEDFIHQPKDHLMTICRMLGISFEEKMIDYDSNQQDPALLSKTAYAHQNIAKSIDRSRSKSYQELPSSMIWVVERFSGQQMRKFNYPILNPRIPLIENVYLKAVLFQNAKKIHGNVHKKLHARCVDALS
jgi:hypothetical protein